MEACDMWRLSEKGPRPKRCQLSGALGAWTVSVGRCLIPRTSNDDTSKGKVELNVRRRATHILKSEKGAQLSQSRLETSHDTPGSPFPPPCKWEAISTWLSKIRPIPENSVWLLRPCSWGIFRMWENSQPTSVKWKKPFQNILDCMVYTFHKTINTEVKHFSSPRNLGSDSGSAAYLWVSDQVILSFAVLSSKARMIQPVSW